jgi:hypothetical protein
VGSKNHSNPPQRNAVYLPETTAAVNIPSASRAEVIREKLSGSLGKTQQDGSEAGEEGYFLFRRKMFV